MSHRSWSRVLIRTILTAVMLIAFVVIYHAALNWRAQTMYNSATTSLRSNLVESRKISADYALLRTRQQQVDAQFDQALHQPAVLLSPLRDNIVANARISRALTDMLNEKTRQQQQRLNNHQNPQSSKQSTRTTSPLNKQQQQKVEQLLKQNNQRDQDPSEQSQSMQDQQRAQHNRHSSTNSSDEKPW